MPQYEAKLSDGRTVTLEADSAPTEDEVLSAVGEFEAAKRREDWKALESALVREQPPAPAAPTQPVSTIAGGPRAPVASLAETMVEPAEEMMRPRVTTPRLPTTETVPVTYFEKLVKYAPGMGGLKALDDAFGEGTAANVLRASVNGLAGMAEFMTSDVGLALPITARAAPVATEIGFAVTMAKDAAQQASQLRSAWPKLTKEQRIESIVNLLQTGAMAAAPSAALVAKGVGLLKTREPPIIQAAQATEQVAPITSAALKEQAQTLAPETVKEKGEQYAVQERGPEAIPVVETPQVSEEVGRQVRVGQEPALPRQEEAQEIATREPPPISEVPSQQPGAPSAAPEGLAPVAGETAPATPPAVPQAKTVPPETQIIGAKAAPTMEGMGGAIPEEFKAAKSVTSTKNAVVDEERVARGEPPMMAPQRRTWGEAWDQAMVRIDADPAYQDTLVADLIKRPRPVSDAENAALLHRRVDLNNEFYKAQRDAEQAYNDAQQFPDRIEAYRAAQVRRNFFSDKLLELEKATGKGGAGTETGRALAARKMMADDDYTLAKLETQKRMDVGDRPLTEAEQAEVESIAERHKKLSEQLDEKLGKAQEKADTKQATDILNTAKQEAKSPKAPRTKLDDLPFPEFVKAAKDKITQRVKEDANSDISNLARKIATRLVRDEGVREREVLIDRVHDILKDVIPDLTRRDTMDALSGYGKYTPLDKAEHKVILRDLYGQMQQIGKLEDMAAKMAPKKTGPERRKPSDEERRLIKQVEEAKRRGGYEVTDPEAQLRTALQAAQTRLENQIKDLEHQIATREKIVRRKTPIGTNAKIEALKARRDELKAVYDEIFKKELTEAERLRLWKERTIEKIGDYKERIRTGQFRPKAKPEPVALDSEALHLRYELKQVHDEWLEGRIRDRIAQETKAQRAYRNVVNSLSLSRTLKTAYDLSAVLRQGAIISFGHWIRAARSIMPMLQALKSEKAQHRVMEEIRTRPNAPLYDRSGLYLAEQGERLQTLEEAFQAPPEWLKKVPGLMGSARAYTTFLNKLRADSFDAMAASMTPDGKPTLAEAKFISNYINGATGRGPNVFGKYAIALNRMFFSPRLVASRFQMLFAQPIWHQSGPLRNPALMRAKIAWEYARFLAGVGVFYALAKLAGGDVEYEYDPRSSALGKLRIGNTRIDPLAGLSQVTTLVAKTITGQKKDTRGRIQPLVGKVPYGKEKLTDTYKTFVRTKLAPVPGAIVDIRTGENVVGEPVTVLPEFEPGAGLVEGYVNPIMQSAPGTLIVPLAWSDIIKVMEEQGWSRGTAISMLSLLGMGVQNYDESRKR